MATLPTSWSSAARADLVELLGGHVELAADGDRHLGHVVQVLVQVGLALGRAC